LIIAILIREPEISVDSVLALPLLAMAEEEGEIRSIDVIVLLAVRSLLPVLDLCVGICLDVGPFPVPALLLEDLVESLTLVLQQRHSVPERGLVGKVRN